MTRYLKLRDDGFSAQRAVPARLLPLVGKKVWQRWIGSGSRADAARRARAFAVETDQLIERLEALSDGEKREIVAAGGLNAWIKQNVAARRNNWLQLRISELAAEYVRPDPEQPEAWQASDALFAARSAQKATVLRSDMEALRRTARKLTGDNAGTLTGLVDLWKKVRTPRNPSSESATRLALKRFIAIVGDLDPETVTPDHVRAFRDRLQKAGHSRVTITKSLERLSAVFACAVAEGKLTSNPFYKIKAHGRANGKVSDRRMPFTRDQIKLILSRLGELKPDERIVMKLAIYHGARPAELCQLRCVDVLNVDGIIAMRLTDEGDGSLKTAASERTIPIHSACADEVVALAERRRALGKKMLFGYEFIASKNTRSHRFSERVGRWLRNKIGITDKRQVAYSARHSFKDACRSVGMPEYIQNQLMGHVLSKGEAGSYGVGVALPELATWLAKIDPLKG